MNILYVEDNVDLANTVKKKLGIHYNVDIAYNSTLGLTKADTTDYDVILVDYYLPDYSGLELCRQIRQSNSQAIILFVTSDDRRESVVSALSSGADDYIVKPFLFCELKARLQAHTRRLNATSNSSNQALFNSTGFILDQANMKIYYYDEPIEVKRKEYLIIEYLFINKGQVVTRERLYEHVWNKPYYSSNTIDVHIRRLRNKLEIPFNTELIETVYGIGYRVV